MKLFKHTYREREERERTSEREITMYGWSTGSELNCLYFDILEADH